MSRISHITLALMALTVLAYSANIVWGQTQQSSAPVIAQAGGTAGTSGGAGSSAGSGSRSNSGPVFFNNPTFNRNANGSGSSGQSFNNQGFNNQGFNNQGANSNLGPGSGGFFSQGSNGQGSTGFNGQGFSGQGIFSQGSNFQNANTGGVNSGGTIGGGFNNRGFNNQGFNNGGFNGGIGFNNGYTGLVPNGITSTNTGFNGNFSQAANNGNMSDSQYQQYSNSLMLQGGVSAGTTGAAPAGLGLHPTNSLVSGHVFTGALGEQTTMYPADFLSKTGSLGPLSQQEAAAWNKMNNNRQVYGPQSLIIGAQNEMKPTVVASKDVLVDGIPQRVSGTVIQEVDYAPDISTLSFERERAGGRQIAQNSLERAGLTTVAEKNAYVRFRSALTRKNHY